jgi:hypothetical protein
MYLFCAVFFVESAFDKEKERTIDRRPKGRDFKESNRKFREARPSSRQAPPRNDQRDKKDWTFDSRPNFSKVN